MTRLRTALGTALLATLALVPGVAAAQAAPQSETTPAPSPPGAIPAAPQPGAIPPPPLPEIAPPPPEPPGITELPDDPDVFRRSTRGVIRIGQDFSLAAGDAVREAVVIFGNATISGQVDGDLVVILGTARLTATADIRQSLVVVGGSAVAESGATVRRDLVVVGGGFQGPPDFAPGGEHVIAGSEVLDGWFQGVVPYISRGLVWGRLIVPDIAWVWGVVALFFLLYLTLNVMFERPVYACARTLAVRPLTAFGAGLLVLLLVGPVSLLLAASVIGLAVVPFVLCAILAAWILGKVAVMRWIGMSVMEEDVPATGGQALRSFVIGFALISIAYMIPVLGIVTWAIVGVLGLGCASLTFFAAYRRENPQKAASLGAAALGAASLGGALPRPAPAVPPPPVPVPYGEPVAPPPPTGALAMDASGAPAAAVPIAATAPPLPPPDALPYAAAGAPAYAAAGAQQRALLAMPKATFRERLAAFLLDVILVAIAVSILDVEGDDVFLPFLLIYHVGFWTWKQTTVGGIITQLRLTRVDGMPLSFADALVRALSAIFSLVVLFIGALWILRDPERQAWHDKIAGTYVVKVPRNWAI